VGPSDWPRALANFAQRTISRDFVVLDRLAATDDRGVSRHGSLRFFDDAFSLFDQTLDGIAFLAGSFLPNRLLKIACNVLIWPFVSSRWSASAALRSALLTALITLGSALVIAFSA